MVAVSNEWFMPCFFPFRSFVLLPVVLLEPKHRTLLVKHASSASARYGCTICSMYRLAGLTPRKFETGDGQRQNNAFPIFIHCGALEILYRGVCFDAIMVLNHQRSLPVKHSHRVHLS